jgi:flavin reductase (DIM6/NTAB) family NADH-FMN oxidoreductase RutF
MNAKAIDYRDSFADLCKALEGDGAFLVVEDSQGKPNPMTIGWATLGVVWGEPILTVYVRPTRHTCGLIEKAKRFSVCVPASGMKRELLFCGSRSGRDHDKVKECGLKVLPGQTKGVSILEDCALFYECETVHKTFVLKETLDGKIRGKYYPSEDFHSVYYGRILKAYRK